MNRSDQENNSANYYFHQETIKNVSVASSAVWVFTHATNYLLSLFISNLKENPGYLIYCGIISFLTSLAIVFVFSHEKNDYQLKSIFISTLNGLLLYVTVNGIHSAYSNINTDSKNNKYVEARMLPFINPKPWLPPLDLTNEIKKQEILNLRISKELQDMLKKMNSQKEKMDSLTNIAENCNIIIDSVYFILEPNIKEISVGQLIPSKINLVASIKKENIKNTYVNGERINDNSNIKIGDSYGFIGDQLGLELSSEIILRNGKLKKITANKKYKIVDAKPNFSAERNIPFLYAGCRNSVFLNLSNFRKNKFIFTATGAELVRGINPGSINLIPEEKVKEVSIGIMSEGKEVGKEFYLVKEIPEPELVINVGNSIQNIDTAKIHHGVNKITFSAMPEEQFKKYFPNDANFIIHGLTCDLVSGNLGRKNLHIDNNVLELNNFDKHSGDYLSIKFDSISRVNFRGEISRFKMSKIQTYYRITLN